MPACAVLGCKQSLPPARWHLYLLNVTQIRRRRNARCAFALQIPPVPYVALSHHAD